jgi:hypothetical protein
MTKLGSDMELELLRIAFRLPAVVDLLEASLGN